MAHPFQDVRQAKVEKSRVGHITKGYASGGGVHADAAADRSMIKRMVKPDALKMDGAKPKARQDKPQRAKGGRVGKTTVNVIVASKDKMPGVPDAPIIPPMPAPPVPPMPPPMPMPRGGPPIPGLGPRASGGRAYAKGGAVKPGPAWAEGLKEGTQVTHDPGKNDTKDIGRGKPITYASGGPVEAPKGRKGMGPNLPGGGRGGLARLAKAERA